MKPHEGTAVTPDTRVDIDSSPKPDLLIQVAPGSINIKRCFWELQWRNRLARGTYTAVHAEQCRGCEFEPHLEHDPFGARLYCYFIFVSEGVTLPLVSSLSVSATAENSSQ